MIFITYSTYEIHNVWTDVVYIGAACHLLCTICGHQLAGCMRTPCQLELGGSRRPWCGVLLTAWSVATAPRRPPARAPFSAAAVPAPRMGGLITNRAALSKSRSHLRRDPPLMLQCCIVRGVARGSNVRHSHGPPSSRYRSNRRPSMYYSCFLRTAPARCNISYPDQSSPDWARLVGDRNLPHRTCHYHPPQAVNENLTRQFKIQFDPKTSRTLHGLPRPDCCDSAAMQSDASEDSFQILDSSTGTRPR